MSRCIHVAALGLRRRAGLGLGGGLSLASMQERTSDSRICLYVSVHMWLGKWYNQHAMALRTNHSLFLVTFVIPISDAIRSLPHSCSGKESDHANHGQKNCGFGQQKSGCCVQSRALRVSTTPLNELTAPVATYAPRHRIKMVSVILISFSPVHRCDLAYTQRDHQVQCLTHR